MKVTGTGVLAAAGLLIGGFLAYRMFSTGRGVLATVTQAAEQGAANVQSAWVNNISTPFQRGQDYMAGVEPVVSSKAWLYSDYGYTGIDQSTGIPITEGEWYSDAVARRYDAEQRAAGSTPPATSVHGAAFGVYPRAF